MVSPLPVSWRVYAGHLLGLGFWPFFGAKARRDSSARRLRVTGMLENSPVNTTQLPTGCQPESLAKTARRREQGAGCDPWERRQGAPRTGIIATARDSWSLMVPLPRLRAPGQQQAQASVSQRASFSSQSASSASPPAGPREPGWAWAWAEQLRPPPPDAPTPSATGSPLARASRKTRYQAGLRADRAWDNSAPTKFSLLPLAARTQWPASRLAAPTSWNLGSGSASLRNMRPAWSPMPQRQWVGSWSHHTAKGAREIPRNLSPSRARYGYRPRMSLSVAPIR